MARALSKQVFQAVGALTAAASVVLWAEVVWSGSQPYSGIRGLVGSRVLAAVITLGLVLVALLAVLLPLRRISDMPDFQDELSRLKNVDLGEAVRKNAALKSSSVPADRRRHDFMTAAAGGILFVTFGAVTLAMLETTRFFIAPPFLAAGGLVTAIVSLVRGLFRRV